MPISEMGPEDVRFQLERVLKGPGFARNQRRSRFLRFLVEQHLEGRDSELKESVIGTEIFGRQPDYDPKKDAIVRAEARRLRVLLDEYYSREGQGDPLIIELPKGSYVPVIRRANVQSAQRAHSRWQLKLSVAGLAIVMSGLALLWARGVVTGLASKPSRERRYETSKAYDLYLRARTAYHPGRELPDVDVDIYQEAIAKDAAFAPAYAGLAVAYAFASSSPTGEKDSLVKMRAAAQTAVQLDPLLPEVHDAMGVVYARLGQWEESRQNFIRAIDLDSSASRARLDSVMNLFLPVGWISNALQQVRLAEKSDPRSPDVQDVYAYVLISAGQFDQAEEHCRKSVDPVECLGRIRIGQGRIDEAIQILTAAPNARYLGYAYGRAGRREDAEKLAAISPGALQQVLIYAGLGDKNRTIDALDRMIELGPVRVGRTLTFPELAFLRGDPRLKALRKKVGLPE